MDVVIVGAGIAGLVAATTLARAGRAVTVFERAAAVGGRAATITEAGYALNLGPHALYTGGVTARTLRDLGVTVVGRDPGNGGHVLHRGALHALPGTPWTFLTTGLFDLRGRLQAVDFVRRLVMDDPTAHDRVSVDAWLAPLTDPTTAAWARALIRVFTYTNDPAHHSAGAVMRQARLALKAGVLYLDGGWGSLVDGLRDAALAAGVTIRTGADVEAIETDGGAAGAAEGVVGAVRAGMASGAARGDRGGGRPRVRVDGAWNDARAVLVATPLPSARRLLPELPSLPAVRAACLDLALAPVTGATGPASPALRFVLGIDRPLYFSVHSETAALAPPGGAVVHVAHYLGPDEHADLAELEALVDRAVPGWRDRVVTRRWLPALTVASTVHLASAPRPGVVARPGVWVAGDWVGAEGELVDTSTASALEAARGILA